MARQFGAGGAGSLYDESDSSVGDDVREGTAAVGGPDVPGDSEGGGSVSEASDDVQDTVRVDADATVVVPVAATSGTDDGHEVRDESGGGGASGGDGGDGNARKPPVIPIVIGCVAVIAILIVGSFLVFTAKKQVVVPDLTLERRSDAEKMLLEAGLKLGDVSEKVYADVEIGDLVVEQGVAAGTKVDEGSKIDVVLSIGQDLDAPVSVPDLTGMTPEQAEAALLEAFLVGTPGESVYSDVVEPGKVCGQSVLPGGNAHMGDIVTYVTSLGHEQVVVPSVAGKTVSEARDALSAAGLSVDTTSAYSDTVPKDVVISQSIEAAKSVDKGSTVSVEVSMGVRPKAQVLVPDVRTYKLEDARRTLESAGLAVKVNGDSDGTVRACSPEPGAKVDQGSTVEITLVKPEVVTVRDTASEQRAAEERAKAQADLEAAQRERDAAQRERQVAERERQEAEQARNQSSAG